MGEEKWEGGGGGELKKGQEKKLEEARGGGGELNLTLSIACQKWAWHTSDAESTNPKLSF